jgi:DNA processing protein
MQLSLANSNSFESSISPFNEMAAYEALWDQPNTSFKKMADMFRANPELAPSSLVKPEVLESYKTKIQEIIKHSNLGRFGVRVNGSFDYPKKLRDAKNPLEILYFQGDWDLAFTSSVAIVGSRKVSEDGARRTAILANRLVKEGYTIVSGLAEGVDSVAHKAAIKSGGRTIAVIGTPLSHVYPKFNETLQHKIAEEHLLISQVPFRKYDSQDYRSNRSFFPERNITMSALTKATIIVEAGETSGTLYQARAALSQGRKLFILDSCFNNKNITWPAKFEKKGAIRVTKIEDIIKNLS